MKRLFAIFTSLALALGAILPYAASAAVAEGTLIKGQTSSAVYYVTAGKRYAFPNERVFFSWYGDFSTVQTVADSDLASYLLSGNVTYRPGMNLLKIATDPKVYAVSHYGVLRWVTTEQIAALLYGSDWNTKVHDVADTFFTNYVVGSELTQAGQYDGSGEQTSAPTIALNLRPSGYVPPVVNPTTPVPPSNPATVVVSVSASQALLNQIVLVTATVSGSNLPITKIDVYSSDQTSPRATCTNTATCSFFYTVASAPASIRFRAIATDSANTALQTRVELQAVLNVSAVSSNLVVGATPYALTSGSRFAFTSDARTLTNITSHKFYIMIPGEPNPVLWKDCGVANLCNGSSPLYRTSQFFSEVLTGGQIFRSASITVTVSGNGVPHPTLTLTSKPAPNQAVLQLTAPSGETIGWSSIVEGATPDSPAVALCELSQCEITVQYAKPTMFTGYTDVGGKLEPSNTINLEP